jgi:hypothetical protein
MLASSSAVYCWTFKYWREGGGGAGACWLDWPQAIAPASKNNAVFFIAFILSFQGQIEKYPIYGIILDI